MIKSYVAIILVNWNGKKDTLECLASLRQVKSQKSPPKVDQPLAEKVKVIVVDNGSTDGSVEAIRNNFPDVEVIETGRNLGFSGGNNAGIRRAREQGADFVWLLNNDTVVDKNALTTLIDACRDSRVGIAGSKIYFASGREYHKERYQETELGKVIWYAGGFIDWENMYASHRGVDEVDKGQYDKTEETLFVTGCSMMVRKEVFEKIGLFDEKFFAYLEDLDYCLRAKRAGYKLLYAPQSVVWHKNAGSSGVGSETHQYYMTRNRLLMGMRYASIRTKFALAREALRFFVTGPSTHRKAVVDAFTGRWGKA
ncbi:MAG: glycosyltransferase family 2 protein [Candidatus Gottesmanbacteria bacterium]|nr:glycosyltransferase family 2 protein [Candidatus Gottesmanbacteria bacterium]